jgi:glutaredoxin-like protein
MSSMLDESIKKQVRELLADMVHPVEIIFFGSQDKEACQYCEETQNLLSEVCELSDRITLSVNDIESQAALANQYKIDAAPGFVMVGREGSQVLDYGVRYKGIPAGHEFTSLINDLLLVSRRESNLSAETKAFLHGLDQPVHLQVFVTPSCPYCPRAVVMAHQFALESPMVEAEMVEAMEFPELSARFQVSGVPQTTINMGAGTMVGAGNEQNLVEEIRAALERTAVK